MIQISKAKKMSLHQHQIYIQGHIFGIFLGTRPGLHTAVAALARGVTLSGVKRTGPHLLLLISGGLKENLGRCE